MEEYGILDHLHGQVKVSIMKINKYPIRIFINGKSGKKCGTYCTTYHYVHNDVLRLPNNASVIISIPWIKRHWKLIVACILQFLLMLLGVWFITSCTSQKTSTDSRYKTFRYYIPSEYFFYQDKEIYHVSSRLDTTLLDRRDIKNLKIDSLTIKYLEFKK